MARRPELPPMRIIGLYVEALKRITAVQIAPDGDIVKIVGENGAGKSSVLDAIWWALTTSRNIEPQPIHDGAERAVIKLDLGAIEVTKTLIRREDGSFRPELKIMSADGAVYPKPAELLESLIGELTFDPIAFGEMKPSEQFEMLRQFATDVDFDEIKLQNSTDYSTRTEVNRQAERAAAAAAAVIIPLNAPAERIDEAALISELEAAGQFNLAIERDKTARDSAERLIAEGVRHVAAIEEEIQALANKINELQNQKAAALSNVKERRENLAKLEPLADEKPTAEIRERLDAARMANRLFDTAEERRRDRAQLEADAAAAKKRSEELTARMAKRTADMQKAIAAAKMPIAGLGFGDGFVTLNGVPFVQASAALKIRAACAIAAALNPKIRIILIKNGSLLDKKGMKLLADFAAEANMQIWVERVEDDATSGFIIEDGHLKGAPPAPKTEE